ncbi:MAG: alcohol dehydrogenase catalytic domain-containing protein [Nitrospirae bacterium]|nr:alcohol dehydrogenase catalytic domain-containing protein [Nitrospirota bacterium]
MLQAQLVEIGRIELKEVPEPEPSEGEIVIKVKAALTCGTDLKAFLRGHSLIPMPGPFGHEYSGVVAKVGRGVVGFKEGDHVMGVHSAPCLGCWYCRRGLYNLCENIMKDKVLGAYAEMLLIPSHVVRQNLFLKPEEIDFTEAALLEPLSCVVHPYRETNLAGIRNALIIGAGPIGLLHAAYLSKRDIVTAIMDVNEERLKIAASLSSYILKPSEYKEIAYRVTDSKGFDLVVECTGQVDVWQQAINFLRRGGILLLFGGCKGGSTVSYSTDRLHYDEITLMGSFHFTPKDVRDACQLIINKTLPLGLLVTESFSLKEISTAFNLLKSGKGIKYAIVP